MSHASILIAIDAPVENIEEAIQFQMEPFEENGWFSDGSRWDWYQVGGRFTGRLSGYDPTQDPANQEVCNICNGTGTRPDGLEQFGAAWVEANHGCNGCNGKGKRPLWPTERKEHDGDIMVVKDIPPARQGEIHAYAFLRNRHWHENERLGWFGTPAKTECALKGREEGKCLFVHEESGARVINWNTGEEQWRLKFYDRFVKPLSPETILVIVDFHV